MSSPVITSKAFQYSNTTSTARLTSPATDRLTAIQCRDTPRAQLPSQVWHSNTNVNDIDCRLGFTLCVGSRVETRHQTTHNNTSITSSPTSSTPSAVDSSVKLKVNPTLCQRFAKCFTSLKKRFTRKVTRVVRKVQLKGHQKRSLRWLRKHGCDLDFNPIIPNNETNECHENKSHTECEISCEDTIVNHSVVNEVSEQMNDTEVKNKSQLMAHIVTDIEDNELQMNAMFLRKMTQQMHRQIDMNGPIGNHYKRITRRTTHVLDIRRKTNPRVVLLDSGFVEYFDGEKNRWKRQTLTNCTEYEQRVDVYPIAVSAKRLEPQNGFIERSLDPYDRKKRLLIKREETKWTRLNKHRVNQRSTYQTTQHNSERVKLLLKIRRTKVRNGIKMDHKDYGTLRPSIVTIPEHRVLRECGPIDTFVKTSQKCLQWMTKAALSYANWDQIV
jgi:hypothetical protein